MRRITFLSTLTFVLTISGQIVLGQVSQTSSAFQIPWDVLSTGGVISSTSNSYQLSASIGQTAIDSLGSTNYHLDSGFWIPSDLITEVRAKKIEELLPNTYQLSQNYPNPFNPETTIQYALPKASHVTIEIRDLLGQRVKVLIDKVQEPGYHFIRWDSRNSLGCKVGSGVYFYRMIASASRGEGFVQIRKMLLVK